MEQKIVKYSVLSPLAKVPAYATAGAAAADLCAALEEPLTIAPMQRVLVPTGLAIELPDAGCVALVYARSGLSIKHGLCMANGVSTVSETIFERRFMHLDELRRMGAHIKLMDHSTILIEGVRELYGAPVTDLRAGAALIVAGLMAKGVTEIYETSYIDRGYERIEEKLRSLGADIRREKLS